MFPPYFHPPPPPPPHSSSCAPVCLPLCLQMFVDAHTREHVNTCVHFLFFFGKSLSFGHYGNERKFAYAKTVTTTKKTNAKNRRKTNFLNISMCFNNECEAVTVDVILTTENASFSLSCHDHHFLVLRLFLVLIVRLHCSQASLSWILTTALAHSGSLQAS